MGAVGGMLGLSGGSGGTGFGSPAAAQIDRPTTVAQAQLAQNQSLNALGNQDFFTSQVLNQNGLQNQSNVFNQLQGVANGTGPNPAQAMLNQATGANVSNQAALMAGQRGANANVGLQARQAANVGANMQQQAIGQGAQMQAQQSLNAIGAMGNMANQQAGNAMNAVQAQTAAAQNQQSNLLNSIAAQNNASVGMQSNVNNANASMSNTRMGQQGNILGNIAGSVGAVAGLFAQGGQVSVQAPNMFMSPEMTDLNTQKPMDMDKAMSAAKSSFGKLLSSKTPAATDQYSQYSASGFSPEQMSNDASRMAAQSAGGLPAPDALDQSYGQQNPQQMMPASADGMPMAANGGKVPVLLSPGEKKLTPKQAEKVAKGGKVEGETVPGKPKVKGAKNSYANDVVKDEAEPGTIILPRSVTQAKHPHWEAHKFVSAIMAKQGKLPSKKSK